MKKNADPKSSENTVAEYVRHNLSLLTDFVRDQEKGFVLSDQGLLNVHTGENVTDPERIHLILAHTYFMAGHDAAMEMMQKFLTPKAHKKSRKA